MKYLLTIIVLLILATLIGCGGTNTTRSTTPRNIEYITIDGWCEDIPGDVYLINEIRVWPSATNPTPITRDYGRRTFELSHGTSVEFISSSSGRIEIKTSDGRTGWVSEDFIKEYK